MIHCTRVYRGEDWADVRTDELQAWLTEQPEWSTERPEGFKGDMEVEASTPADPAPEPTTTAPPETSSDDGKSPPPPEEAPTGGPLVPGTRVHWTKPCGTLATGTLDEVSGEHAIVAEDGKKKIKVRLAALKATK